MRTFFSKSCNFTEKLFDIGAGFAAGGGVWAIGAMIEAGSDVEITAEKNLGLYITFVLLSVGFGLGVAGIKTVNLFIECVTKDGDESLRMEEGNRYERIQ